MSRVCLIAVQMVKNPNPNVKPAAAAANLNSSRVVVPIGAVRGLNPQPRMGCCFLVLGTSAAQSVVCISLCEIGEKN
jgi:hypothetical protein